MIFQILLIIGFVIYIISCIPNIMDDYSEESRQDFKEERNWKISLAVILFLILYFCGSFSHVIPSIIN